MSVTATPRTNSMRSRMSSVRPKLIIRRSRSLP
jgi:hypothetical protein